MTEPIERRVAGVLDGLGVPWAPTLLEPDWIILGGGSRASKIKVAPRVLERVPNARVVVGLTLAVEHRR